MATDREEDHAQIPRTFDRLRANDDGSRLFAKLLKKLASSCDQHLPQNSESQPETMLDGHKDPV